MEVKGKVVHIGTPEAVSDKLTKMIFVIEMQNGQYKDNLALELMNQKVALADVVRVGDDVQVSINVQSREWNGKWFTSASAWKVEVLGGAPATPARPAQQVASDDDRELPF
jgi:hypothetical protein